MTVKINQILLIEDDREVRNAITQTLRLEKFDVIECSAFIEAKDHISSDFLGLVLTDIRMPGRDGFYVNQYCKEIDSDLPVIFLSGEGDIPMAVRAIAQGGFDFLEKPCSSEKLLPVISRALKTRELVIENRNLKKRASLGDMSARMIFGRSEKVEKLRQIVRTAGNTNSEVIISGAPGTGISKIAEVIHLSSDRAKSPLEKRSAVKLDRYEFREIIDRCNGGTLFLDAIDQCPFDTQVALIDFLENDHSTRIIAGTHVEIADLEQSDQIISDLFYKLATHTIRIPSINERMEDIPVLYEQYVSQAAEQSGTSAPDISDEKISELMSRDWSGNARALMNDAMRFVLGLSEEKMVETATEAAGLNSQMADFEKSLLEKALQKHRGRSTQAAQELRLPRKTFYDKLSKHGLRAEDFRH